MRPLGAGLALTLTFLALLASSAAANPVSGKIERGGAGEDQVVVTLRNDGNVAHQSVAVVFPEGTEVVSVLLVSGPGANCFVQPNKRTAQCNFNDPFWFPGGEIVISVRTKPRLADNAGAQVFVQDVGGGIGGPFIIEGPSSAADLGLTLSGDETGYWGFSAGAFSKSAILQIRAELTNHGPDAASNVTLLLGTPDAPARTFWTPWEIKKATEPHTPHKLEPHPACSEFFGGVRCSFGGTAPGAIHQVVLVVTVRQPGVVRATGLATADTSDPGPMPNQAEQAFTIARLPVSGNGVLNPTFKVFSGAARGATNVAVGVAEVKGGAAPAPPKKERSSERAGATAKASCRWLTSTRVRFRRESGKRCDEPSYLRAKVKKGRWKLKLRKRLPAGRYVMITRAIGSSGAIEGPVSRKRGNLVKFSVP